VTHGGGRGGFEVIAPEATGRVCALPENPNSMAEQLRALRLAITDWVVKNTPPPDSRYPTLAAGDLAPPVHNAMGFPAIAGAPLPDNLINPLSDYDFGSQFRYTDLSGFIEKQPPAIRGTIPLLVPRTNSDGNEASGIPSVLHQAPLGTYLGWNVAKSGYLQGRGCGFQGGVIPFSRTKAERLSRDDPRPSLEERYGSHEAYVSRVRDAARRMVQQRFLLPDDAERVIREAEASRVLQ
jgi:hypothetical protein